MTIRSAAGGLRLLRLTIVGALLTLIVSSGAGVTATDLARQHAALKPVTVATLRIEPGALAFYAKDEGFFARQGLDVKVLPLSDPSQLAAALLSGDVQFSGFNIGGAAILKSRSAPVKVVAAGALYRPADPTTAVVAARGKRIAGARDLIGKTIAIDAQNTIAHIGLLKWLKANRVSASHVHLTEIPFAQMLGPLRRGTVDAALLPEPFVTLALRPSVRRTAS